MLDPTTGKTDMLKTLALPIRITTLAVIYIVLGLTGSQLIDLPGSSVLTWSAAGIALAALFVAGVTIWPGIFLGAFGTAFLISGVPAIALAVGVSSLNLPEVLDELLTQLATLVPYISASIALIEEDGLHFVAQRGIPEGFDLRQIEVKLNKLDTARFVAHPIIFKDVRQAPDWIPVPGFQEYIRSWMGLSLIHRGKIIGVLNLAYDAPDFYTPMHANLAEAVAQQAALAIENARLYGDLEQLVQERTRELETANQRLTESIDKLQELDKLRAKFVADVSHELRTPLTVLNTRVYLLEHGGPARQSEYLPGLKEQVERLSSFVESILDLSRMEKLRENTTFSAVDLNNAAAQVVTLLQPRTDEVGLALSFAPGADLPMVRADSNQVLQVITNLVANAIHYTPEGWVRLASGFDTECGMVWLNVQDSGMGIAEEDIPHLFERFYRGRAGSSSIPGTGLGLSIVKEIMDIHGGHITVSSEVDKGTTFTIWLLVAEM
jgi:signal transduction histidine kinase